MTEMRINEIANEEAVNIFPEFKNANPTYIFNLAQKATDKYVYFYDLSVIDSESRVREKLITYLKDLRRYSGLKWSLGT